MSISEVASGTAVRDGVGNSTLTKPAAASAGDVGILDVAWDSTSTTTVATPTGFTNIGVNVGNTSMKTSLFYRVLQAGDSTWAINISNVGNSLGWVFKTYSGVDNTTPIDATGTTSTNTGANTITANAVTIVTAGAWHLVGLGAWNGSTVFSATGFTALNNGATANQPGSLLWNTTAKSTGSTGTVLVTASGSATGQILSAIPFALRPAAVVAETYPAGHSTRLRTLQNSVLRMRRAEIDYAVGLPGTWPKREWQPLSRRTRSLKRKALECLQLAR